MEEVVDEYEREGFQKYPDYDNMDQERLYDAYQDLLNRFSILRGDNDKYDEFDDVVSKIEYIKSILGKKAETSFTDNDDGKTVTIRGKGFLRSHSAPEVEFIDTKDRPINNVTPAIEDFISRNHEENFKFNKYSDKVTELRLNINKTVNNNITFKPLTTRNERGVEQIVLKRDADGVLQYNTAKVAQDAVRQFKDIINYVLEEQGERDEIINESPMLETEDVCVPTKGLTAKENREVEGVFNQQTPSTCLPDGTKYNPRLGNNGALQIQADNFQETINKTIEQWDNTEDVAEYIDLEERIMGLREARERILEQREKEEVRELQEEDVTRLQRLKEWLKSNKEFTIGLTAVTLSIAGIITSIIVSARTALYKGSSAVGKLAKAV